MSARTARKSRIRLAEASDVEGLLALEQSFATDRLSRAALRRFLRVPSARLWVAVQAREVVGSVLLLLRAGAQSGRIYSLVVAERARGQGLGQRLLATAERAAKAAGRTTLRLEVRTHNRPARALYAQRGYTEVMRLPGYYEDGAAGIRLQKVL